MALPDPSTVTSWHLTPSPDQPAKVTVWVAYTVPRSEALDWIACTPAPQATRPPVQPIVAIRMGEGVGDAQVTHVPDRPTPPDPLSRTLADTPPPQASVVEIPGVGGRWDGVLVSRRSDKDGSTVLVLEDQRMVRLDTATGRVLGSKTPGYMAQAAQAAGPGDLTIKPTSRQGGPGAPRTDPDVSTDPDHRVTPAMMAARTPAELVTAALESGVPRGRLVDWALEVHQLVPVLRPVSADKLPDRIARALVVLGAQ